MVIAFHSNIGKKVNTHFVKKSCVKEIIYTIPGSISNLSLNLKYNNVEMLNGKH